MSKLAIGTAALSAVALLIALSHVVAAGAVAAHPGSAASSPDERAPMAMPAVQLAYSAEHGVRLSGTVPDDLERQALVQRAQQLYGSQRVDDQLHAGAVANPAWLNPAFLPDLRGTRQAIARLADARLDIEGTVDSEAARAQVTLAMADIGSRGSQVVSRLALHTP